MLWQIYFYQPIIHSYILVIKENLNCFLSQSNEPSQIFNPMNLKLRLGYEFGSRINRVGGIGLMKTEILLQFYYREVTMIEYLFLTLSNISTYEDFKKQPVFQQKLQPYSCWAFRSPLTIFTSDLKQKHTFTDGRVLIENVESPSLEQKWKFFVITRSDSTRTYCASYVFYEKKKIKEEQSSFFTAESSKQCEYYIPTSLVLKSENPYFKLLTNLIKIHRELRRENSSIYQKISKQNLEAYENELRGQCQGENFRKKLRTSLISLQKRNVQSKQLDTTSNVSIQALFQYYISSANEAVLVQKIYICPQQRYQILHVYNIPESLYRINYFFHLPISRENIMTIIAAILQQKQIIFTSNNQNSNLMLMQTILDMLSPLSWEYMYVPNLPESMLDAAEYSFMPYMVGVHRKYLDRISRAGRIVVHVDTDRIQMNQKIIQLPSLLKSMLSINITINSPELTYIQWEKQTRMKSMLMVSTLLSQFPIVEQKLIHNPDYSFYHYFFEISAMYKTFKNQINKPINIEINELFWIPVEVKLQIMQSKFKNTLNGASFPTICENDKQWIKYYYNHIEKGRKSLKYGRQSYNSTSLALLRSSTISTMSPTMHEVKQENRNKNKIRALAKKGLGFIHNTNIKL